MQQLIHTVVLYQKIHAYQRRNPNNPVSAIAETKRKIHSLVREIIEKAKTDVDLDNALEIICSKGRFITAAIVGKTLNINCHAE